MKSQEMLRIVGWVVVALALIVGVGLAFFGGMSGSSAGGLATSLIGAGVVVGGLALGAPFLAFADLLDKMDRQHAAIESLHRTMALQTNYASPAATTQR